LQLFKLSLFSILIDDYEFAKLYWSYLFQNIKAERLMDNIKIYSDNFDQRTAKYGKMISNVNYIDWFVNNHRCMPTTLNTCEVASKIFVDTKEMKELCGSYMPFLSIHTSSTIIHWQQTLHFKTKFYVSDYFDLLEQIRHDEKNLNINFHRIQIIYSQILDQMCSWSCEDKITVRTRTRKLFLLTENNQWKLANTLFMYMEDNGPNNSFGDTIPCLKLDNTNKQHKNLRTFLELFDIKPIHLEDLNLVHIKSHPAEKFRQRLAEILPYLKKYLTHSNFSSNTISSIDKILQKDVTFFESDCLKLFYSGKTVDETDVYYDTVRQKLYFTRPWNTELVLMTLPKKICQLFNINGCEAELRFLLKAEREEIVKHLKRMSIEISTDKDVVPVESPTKSDESVQPIISTEILSSTSSTSAASMINKEVSCDNKVTGTINKADNRKTIIDSTNDVKFKLKTSSHLCQDSSPVNEALIKKQTVVSKSIPVTIEETIPKRGKRIRRFSSVGIELNDEPFDSTRLIDVSSICISTTYSPVQNGESGESELITGHIGEYIAYKYLSNKYRHQTDLVLIKWENEHEESHLPYDILLIENGKENYIEVKSTRKYNQHSFPLSFNQIETIIQHPENYFIYRVYIDENKLLILDKVEWRLKHKEHLSCFLTIESPSNYQNIHTNT